MFGHQCLLKVAMCSHYPGRVHSVAKCRVPRSNTKLRDRDHMFDLSKDVPSGIAAVWLVPIGSFRNQITYYQLGHPNLTR